MRCMLTSRISVPPPTNPEPEDIFSSALENLFTDDTQNSHGVPGGTIIYTSPCYGPITLRIPAHPDVDEGRQLFAHYLWNAALVAADGLERASSRIWEDAAGSAFDRKWWDVRGKNVLELGAGTALPSLISALCGAETVTVTDHPSSPALTTGAIEQNVKAILVPAEKANRKRADVSIRGYVWGETVLYSAERYGAPASTLQCYDKLILCDCLWMPSQHASLVRTISSSLGTAATDSCAIIVAGFHTGRAVIKDFFALATGANQPLKQIEPAGALGPACEARSECVAPLRVAEMYEIDVGCNRRAWQDVRESESKQELKRWCVVSVLVKS